MVRYVLTHLESLITVTPSGSEAFADPTRKHGTGLRLGSRQRRPTSYGEAMRFENHTARAD